MRRERHPQSTGWADEALFIRMLDEASTVTNRQTLDRAVCLAVQKAFLATRVTVAWFLSHNNEQWVFLRGARADTIGRDPTPLLTLDRLPDALRTNTVLRPMARRVGRHVAPHPHGVDLRLRWPEAGRFVEVRCFAEDFVDLPRSPADLRRPAVAAELARSGRVLGELVQVLRPMHRFARESALAETRREVETWITNTRTFELHDPPDPADRAKRATGLVDQARILLNRVETTKLDRQRIRTAVERVVRSIVHTVMSAGWRADGRPGRARRARESEHLARLVASLDVLPGSVSGPPGARMDVHARVHLLRAVLAAAAGTTPAPTDALGTILVDHPDTHTDDHELRLFAAWAIVHDLAHAEQRRPSAGADRAEAAWTHALTATRRWLPGVLTAWTTHGPPTSYTDRDPFHVGAVRNWLYLWFAHHVLPTEAPAVADRATWRTRQAIAHVLRETLRNKLYSSSPGYTRRADRFTEALEHLVDRHVVLDAEIHLPHNIRGHLALVGDARHPRGARFSDGHLHHVLELFVAGHFLLSSRLVGLPAPFVGTPTAAEALAHPGGGHLDARRTRDLLAAWSLAALYHDVGLSLFPEFRPPRDLVTRMHPSASDGLESVRATLDDGGKALATRAREALLADRIYDPEAEPVLAAWVDRQLTTGHPSHALTGAWYLHCAAALLEDLRPEISREAVRAVLLHAAPTHIIDVQTDPVAALLALCDELFEWDPSDPPLRVPAGSVAPRPSRAAALQFTQLRVQVDDDGQLDTALHLDHEPVTLTDGGPPSWPRVRVGHVHPEKLDGHVFPMWLAVAQNICRIKPGRHGFAPVIDLWGPVPRHVQRAVDSSHHLLGAMLGEPTPWGPPIALWYHAGLSVQVTELETDTAQRPIRETRRVFPIGKAITDDDIRSRMAELRNIARRLLLDFDADG